MVLLPAMKVAIILCLIMSVMLLVEKLSMGLVSLWAKVFKRKPEGVYKWEPIKEDVELGILAYPMVLIQVPMFNEKEAVFMSLCIYAVFINNNTYMLLIFHTQHPGLISNFPKVGFHLCAGL